MMLSTVLRRDCQHAARVGHAGTLDPLATGVLLVCVGRATRLVEYLVGQQKVYEADHPPRANNRIRMIPMARLMQERPLSFTPQDLENCPSINFAVTSSKFHPCIQPSKRDGQPLV